MKTLVTLILLLMLVLLVSCATRFKPLGAVDCTPPSGGYFCTEVQDPVCGSDGTTYSNSCKACGNELVVWYTPGIC